MPQGWEQEAENWISWARTPDHDAYWYYSSTFFQDIVPPAHGLTLEIGCGEGRVARDLSRNGHEVVAVDASTTLVAAAAAVDPTSVYLVAEAERLPFHDSGFELVVAYNSLMDVEDMPHCVREAARVVKMNGRLCICITHPINAAGEFEDDSADATFKVNGSYFDRRKVEERYKRDGLEMTFRSWCYPLSAYSKALEQAGFVIERMDEPTPDAKLVVRLPRLTQWQRVPMFLFIRALKRAHPSDARGTP